MICQLVWSCIRCKVLANYKYCLVASYNIYIFFLKKVSNKLIFLAGLPNSSYPPWRLWVLSDTCYSSTLWQLDGYLSLICLHLGIFPLMIESWRQSPVTWTALNGLPCRTTFTYRPVARLFETIYDPFSQHVKKGFLLFIHLILHDMWSKR